MSFADDLRELGVDVDAYPVLPHVQVVAPSSSDDSERDMPSRADSPASVAAWDAFEASIAPRAESFGVLIVARRELARRVDLIERAEDVLARAMKQAEDLRADVREATEIVDLATCLCEAVTS